MTADFRAGILDEAKGYVTADRNAAYGEPEDNFQAIADMWNAQGFRMMDKYNEPCAFTATGVALAMAGMKLARLKHNAAHRDSWVDAAGYLACGAEIALEGKLTADERTAARRVAVAKGLSEGRVIVPDVEAASANWCGVKNSHEPHGYTRSSLGGVMFSGNDYWCDGVLPVEPQAESDIEVVKRVADKLACGGKEPHHNC